MEKVFERSSDFQTATDRGELVRDLLGGTPAMIAAGEMYLPKQSAEHPDDYKIRLRGGYLFNGYKRTRNYLVGLVFSEPVKIGEDSPNKDQFTAIENDVDQQGNNLRTWAQAFFEAGIDDGMVAVLVDFPQVQTRTGNGRLEFWDEENEIWRAKTAAIDAEKGWRPFFVLIHQANILGVRFVYENGKRILDLIRIFETVTDQHGDFDNDDTEIEQVRVLRRGSWHVYRKDDKDNVFLHSEGETSLDEIPIAFFRPGEPIGNAAAPALEDLAQLNKRHWQSTCDQVSLMSFVRRPPWFGKLLTDADGAIEFGPGRLIHAVDSGADLKSVSVNPEAVDKGKDELLALEEKMALYGLVTLQPNYNSGSKTAFQSQQETTESTSLLKSWALGCKDTLDNAFRFAGMWMGLEDGQEPRIDINTEFNPAAGMEPTMMMKAIEAGVLSREQVHQELKRRGLIGENWDWQDVKAMIEDDSRFGGPAGALTGLADQFPAVPGTPTPAPAGR
jgi:hypothetical protein